MLVEKAMEYESNQCTGVCLILSGIVEQLQKHQVDFGEVYHWWRMEVTAVIMTSTK